MRRWLALAVAIVAQAISCVHAKSATGDSVLVILEKDLQKEQFSTFFGGLEERGFELTFREPKAKTPLLIEDDVPQFSHVVFFSPTTKSYAADLSPQSLVSLVSQGVNILFTLSTTQTPLVALASEFSLIPTPPHTPLISHFPARNGPHTIVSAPVPAGHPVLSSGIPPVLFEGAPHAFAPNPLLVPILRAPPESFASDTESDSGADSVVDSAEKGGEGLWAGSQLGLVTGFQTRSDNGRALWAGGVSVFSDEFAKKEDAGNARFAQDVAKWVFQESNVLRIDEAFHRFAGSNATVKTSTPEHYTVNDQVEYTARISKWDPQAGEWAHYSGLTDVQLEFTMLDPHVRTALPADKCVGKRCPGTYTTVFRAPDRHGVFKFVLEYKRMGWTFLSSALTVPVVPPRHDGYPRFLSAAWPYYAGAISSSIGFVLFTALWLAGGGAERESRKGKKVE